MGRARNSNKATAATRREPSSAFAAAVGSRAGSGRTDLPADFLQRQALKLNLPLAKAARGAIMAPCQENRFYKETGLEDSKATVDLAKIVPYQNEFGKQYHWLDRLEMVSDDCIGGPVTILSVGERANGRADVHSAYWRKAGPTADMELAQTFLQALQTGRASCTGGTSIPGTYMGKEFRHLNSRAPQLEIKRRALRGGYRLTVTDPVFADGRSRSFTASDEEMRVLAASAVARAMQPR